MIPCDGHGKMNLKKLVSSIKSSIKNGERPFFIGATAGTTVRGVFDPIKEIAIICKQYNLWFHNVARHRHTSVEPMEPQPCAHHNLMMHTDDSS